MRKIFKRLIELLDYRFFVGIGAIWLIVILTPGFVPDLLNIKGIIAEKDLVAVLLSIITSLFGILIAFILLSFSIFRDKFGRVALNFLIEERNFRFLINLLLSVSLHLLIAYIVIYGNKDITDFSITIAYISIYFFVGSLFLLFPISFNTLSSPDSLKNIEDCISKITKNDIDNLIYNRGLSDLETVENIDENSFSVVQKYGVSLLRSDDKLGFSLLLKK